MSYEAASSAIIAHVGATWGTPVEYPNLVLQKKPDDDTWARLAIDYVRGYAAALGNELYRRDGLVGFQIFVPKNDKRGPAYLAQLEDAAATMFEGVKLDPAGVKFYGDVTPRRNGNINEGWFQINVTANFSFDQIR